MSYKEKESDNGKLSTPFNAAFDQDAGKCPGVYNHNPIESVSQPKAEGIVDLKFTEDVPIKEGPLETAFHAGADAGIGGGKEPTVSQGTGGLSTPFVPAFGKKSE